MNGNRMRTLGVGGQQLLDYLNRMQAENPAFVYAIQTGSDHSSLGNIFWADATAKINYAHFGDTVTFDTSSRTNRFRVPFVSFTGLNHHGQPVLFGCALMVNESENSFVWLFQVWLHAMSGRCPVSITTDPDGLIQSAVAQVFPQTRHRFCKRRILREIQEKLGHIYQAHPTFETELNMCINETETIDEFESSWQSLQHRYYLLDNEWLMNMYSVRQQWVPAYMRNTFFGELSATDDSECLDSFFSSFINASTTIQTLIKQYEKAVSSWHEKELDADYDTINTIPVLKTPSPMEKQAANLYTRRIFMKFQDELVETLAISATRIDESGTITTYRVAKYGEEHKAHTVTFDSFEMKADCSCQMFEYSGVICRHILAVFRAKNVLMLPPQYVLKRWTRDAKSGAAEVEESTSELPVVTQETLSIRYNNLRQEAIKYVEEGAKSIQNYNVAMAALQEAAKKVAAVKAQHSGARQDGCMNNGGSQEVHFAEENDSSLQSTAAKDAKIREMTAELESVNQRCEMYRANLFAILRDMEEQKSKLLVKVQNAKLSL